MNDHRPTGADDYRPDLGDPDPLRGLAIGTDATAAELLADLVDVVAQANAENVAAAVEEYERRARANRPDWQQFLADADEDPAGIGYEIAETATDIGRPVDVDAAMDAAAEWLAGLDRDAFQWSTASARWQVEHGERGTARTTSALAWLEAQAERGNTTPAGPS